MPLFKKKTKSCLGIDIGTTCLKIVELSSPRGKGRLENYGEMSVGDFGPDIPDSKNKESPSIFSSVGEISKAISDLSKEAGFKTNKAVFSIPDFSTFFTTFELPIMDEKEVPDAIMFQANKYVPLPLSEMKIDWAIIEGKPGTKTFFGKERPGTKLKILLVTVPNEVILQYQEIAKRANLDILFLEAEVFSLVRSLVWENKGVIVLIDIGGRSTTCNIIEDGILKSSYSFDISGNEFTYALSRALDIDYNEAERLKREIGIRKGAKEEEILYPLIDLTLREIKKISRQFSQVDQKEISKIVLAGGGALLPGLADYFFEQLKIKTIIADPFVNIEHPPLLREALKKMGPSYAIAVGLALKGLEKLV